MIINFPVKFYCEVTVMVAGIFFRVMNKILNNYSYHH